ncbi:hypothetical protein [Mycoplasma sp. E35C]|uniref:hypothetical protein n=1 Tax=Mycoplasma sp. E35C TaxID=2801918 RepID=UPI001CA41855|nr:hypothetical protein [Mycoplasma sp. E35C]QZX49243.1 hypothetical protein JJE79_00510 [Mycoplasma sp. E35C]
MKILFKDKKFLIILVSYLLLAIISTTGTVLFFNQYHDQHLYFYWAFPFGLLMIHTIIVASVIFSKGDYFDLSDVIKDKKKLTRTISSLEITQLILGITVCVFLIITLLRTIFGILMYPWVILTNELEASKPEIFSDSWIYSLREDLSDPIGIVEPIGWNLVWLSITILWTIVYFKVPLMNKVNIKRSKSLLCFSAFKKINFIQVQ